MVRDRRNAFFVSFFADDPITRRYNESMIRILPKYGISFIKINRITTEGPDGKPEVISASRVRKLLDEQGVTDEVLSLVP